MTTSKTEPFAIWLTGLPASGKSTLAAALTGALLDRGLRAEVLESDALRRALTPHPTYTGAERDAFYAAIVHLAEGLIERGTSVIIDATGHRRVYRDDARARLPRFLEVFVDCPIDVCASRDPKGLYRAAPPTLPGTGVPYEAPLSPEIVVHADRELPMDAAARILARLEAAGWLSREPAARR